MSPQHPSGCGDGDLHALFLADQAAAQAPSAASSSSTAVGWGGQPIAADSSACRVPWFGRRRGAPSHRQRQPRGVQGGEAGLLGSGACGGSVNASSSGCGGSGAGSAAADHHLRSPQQQQPTMSGFSSSGSHPSPSSGQQHQQQQHASLDVMSVEEVVALLRRTPRADPLPPRVCRALHHLDSRSVALLLKDTSKAGMDARSIELFDWLRALPERHLLRSLCDVYTYTAMISLCIYQQSADRAMELLAEMRARGVERNVHTYTALMNVCIKCGKLPAALDIFAAMKAEGCTPNVVTYNTLIDVHGKLGQWDKAVGVLAMMRAEGVTPALRTFNTLIIACNMCNQPREALAVYDELCGSGFEANSTTYNALISAHGKLGQLERVLEVYQDMCWRGLERSVITYSSLISACEKAGRWETALKLFDEMQRDGCTPNTVTYNSLITACGQGAQWEQARAVYESMQANGCVPDVVTYTALISAYERGGQWLAALTAFEQMTARGCRPDGIIYNAIIDALWQTGVLWAQVKARELFAAAVKQGHFRNERVSPNNTRSELNLHALTAGVAMLSLQSWLLDIQRKVATEGDAALPALLAIVTDAGSASKEQGNFIIKDAASTSMSFWGSPFRPVQNSTFLGVLEAPGPALAAWVRSTAFGAMMASLFPPHADATLQQGALSTAAIQQRETGALQECRAAFDAVRRFEGSHNLALQHMGSAFVAQRSVLVASVLEKGGALGLRDEVVHDAVLLLDRTGSTGVQVTADALPVVAAASLHICMQQGAGSGAGSDPQQQQQQAAGLAEAFGVSAQAVLDMAWQLRQVLQDDTLAISAMRVLKVYLERMGCRHLDRRGVYVLAGLPIMLAVDAQFDSALLNCRPSVVAAALLYAERRQRGAVPFWPSVLAKLTGYEDLTAPELACAVRAAQKLCRKVQYTQTYKTQSVQLAAAQQMAAGGATGALVSAPPPSGGDLLLQQQHMALGAAAHQPALQQFSGQQLVAAGSLAGGTALAGMQAMAPGAAMSQLQPVQVSDLALLMQLQQQRQQQQQQAAAANSQQPASILVGSNGLALDLLAGGLLMSPQQQHQQQQPAPALNSGWPAAGTSPACFMPPPLTGSTVGGLVGGVPLATAGLVPPAANTALYSQQPAADVSGLESLAFSLSVLGLNGPTDAQINAASLEAALGQR